MDQSCPVKEVGVIKVRTLILKIWLIYWINILKASELKQVDPVEEGGMIMVRLVILTYLLLLWTKIF